MLLRIPALGTFILSSILSHGQFGPRVLISKSSEFGSSSPTAGGDLNGDGYADVVSGWYNGDTWIFLAGDHGRLFQPQMIWTTTMTDMLVIDDLDGDGDGDIIGYANNTSGPTILVNDDYVHFDPLELPSNYDGKQLLTMDIDNDGLKDIVCGAGSQLWWYRQESAMQFGGPYVVASGSGVLTGMCPMDLDGDGVMDVAFAQGGTLWCSHYAGLLTFDAPAQVRADTKGPLRAGDFNNDGISDVLAMNNIDVMHKDVIAICNYIWLYVDIVLTTDVAASLLDPCAFDVDGDEDDDVIISAFYVEEENASTVLLNDGAGNFSPGSTFIPKGLYMGAMDADNDGDVDILRSTIPQWTYNEGGTFNGTNRCAVRNEFYGLGYLDADFDNDGLPDVLGTSYSSSWTVNWMRNNGRASSPEFIAVKGSSVLGSERYETADLDADGDVDVLSTDAGLNWCRNSGGRFTYTYLDTVEALTSAAAGTFTNDGLLDIAYVEGNTSANRRVQVVANQGNGVFGAPQYIVSFPWDDHAELKAFDVEGDGDDDLLIGLGGSIRWIAKDGTSLSGAVQTLVSLPGLMPGRLQPADIDGDGDLDVGFNLEAHPYWIRNDGGGQFAVQPYLDIPFGLNNPDNVHVADIDGDGDPDFTATFEIYGTVGYWSNHGDGTFDDMVEVTGSFPGPLGIGSVDLNGDGDRELIVGSHEEFGTSYFESHGDGIYRISGTVYNDLNGNGTHDGNEPWLANVSVRTTPWNELCVTDADGGFRFNVSPGGHTIEVNCDAAIWEVSTPLAQRTVTLTEPQPESAGHFIGIHAVSNATAIAISHASQQPRCSEVITQQVTVLNTGSIAAHGIASLVLGPLLSYVDAVPAPTSVNGDTLIWDVGAIGPYSSFDADVRVLCTAALWPGNLLTAGLYFTETDDQGQALSSLDYFWSSGQGCSHDPNGKEVDPLGSGPEGAVDISTPFLDYTIHFQNTGTAPALDIVLRDQLPNEVDAQGFTLLAASHPPTRVNIDGLSELVVEFDGINLPDSGADFMGSEGYIKFRCPLRPGLGNGTQVRNGAGIYFDQNPVVLTDTTFNLLVDCDAFTMAAAQVEPELLMATEASTFSWFLNGDSIPGAHTQDLIIDQTGTYVVIGVNAYGCTVASDPLQVIALSIPGVNRPAMLLAPNPSSGDVRLITTGAVLPTDLVRVLDTQGRIVLEVRGSGSPIVNLRCEGLGAGTYVVQLRTGTQVLTGRLVKR